MPQRDIPLLLAMFERDRLGIDQLFGPVLRLDEPDRALDALLGTASGRVLFEVSGSDLDSGSLSCTSR